jgi:hypothetical protein
LQQDPLQRRQEVVDVYKRVTGIIWQRLSPTFGIRTINAIARNIISRKGQEYPALLELRVEQDGLVWQHLEAQLGQIDEEQIHQMLDEFLDEFFEALANLIGKLVVGKIFKEAEEMVRKGDGE